MINSILDTIGNTPLVRLEKTEQKFKLRCKLYAKLEYFNPFGSIKDRAALQIIKDAEEGNKLLSKIVVEATSGNLGIALSAISQIRGYKSIIVMPENASKSRKQLLDKYGAKVILTDSKLGMQGAIQKAKEIQNSRDLFYSDQFNNYSSVNAHFLSTAKEIDLQTGGNVDMVVCGIGSGGTICGIAKYFQKHKHSVKIIGVLPNTHPHKIQGIGAGFMPSILDIDLIGKILYVSYEDAVKYQEILLQYNSIFAGLSSGAALGGIIRYLQNNDCENKNIVIIFPDGGERYL